VQLDRCANAVGGRWEELPNLPEITFMHAVLLANSSRILYWSYGQRPDQTRLWDQATGLYTQPLRQPIALAADENIWSGAHAHLNDAAGNVLLLPSKDAPQATFGETLRRRQRLGGLLNYYGRAA
jgi:hypothetical protein